jgi:hypothetical protein
MAIRRNAQNIDVAKARSPPDESLVHLRQAPQNGDFSKYEDEDTPETDKPPIKAPATVLSNGNKESNVKLRSLADDNKTGQSIMFITQKPLADAISPEMPPLEDEEEEDSHNGNVAIAEVKEKDAPIKMQRRARILPNVDKLPPIDLPGENEDRKLKDATEPNDETATD